MTKKTQIKKILEQHNKSKKEAQSMLDKLAQDAIKQVITLYASNQTYNAISLMSYEELQKLQRYLNETARHKSKSKDKNVLSFWNNTNSISNIKQWIPTIIQQKKHAEKMVQDSIDKEVFVEDIADKLSSSEFQLLRKYMGMGA